MCNCLFTFYITDTVIDASCFVLLMHLVWMATIYATRSSNAPRAAMFTLNQSPGMCRTCLIDLKSFFVLFIANVSQNILVMSALERISMNTSIAPYRFDAGAAATTCGSCSTRSTICTRMRSFIAASSRSVS